MTNRPPIADALTVAADLVRDLDRLGVHVATVTAQDYLADITLGVASAFDRTVSAVAFDLVEVSEPYGDVVRPLLRNSGTVTHHLGEFRVEVYGPAADREAVA